MSLSKVPTVKDIESVVRYVEDVKGFERDFGRNPHPTLDSRENRFRRILASMTTGDALAWRSFIRPDDYAWVEEHARDARRPGTFPEGCAGRFRAARIMLEMRATTTVAP